MIIKSMSKDVLMKGCKFDQLYEKVLFLRERVLELYHPGVDCLPVHTYFSQAFTYQQKHTLILSAAKLSESVSGRKVQSHSLGTFADGIISSES